MRLERLNTSPLNTATPNFVAIFVFFGTDSSFIERISFSERNEKPFLFLFGYSEVNSTWIITSGLAERQKHYSLVWYILIIITSSIRAAQLSHGTKSHPPDAQRFDF